MEWNLSRKECIILKFFKFLKYLKTTFIKKKIIKKMNNLNIINNYYFSCAVMFINVKKNKNLNLK